MDHNDHLIVCVHESVPRALDAIGMHDFAKLLKAQGLSQPEELEQVQIILDNLGPELTRVNARVASAFKGANSEMAAEAQKYQEGINIARYVVLAAKQTTKLAAQGRLVLN